MKPIIYRPNLRTIERLQPWRPRYLYRRRLHLALAIAANGVLSVIAGIVWDFSPDFTLAASLVTLAACGVAFVNLSRLR